MNDEQAFLQALQASPRDEVLRLVYADWLEERGDPRAEFLRLDVKLTRRRFGKGPTYERRLARWHELRTTLDAVWVAKVAQASWGVVRDIMYHLEFAPNHTPGGLGWDVRDGGACPLLSSGVEKALRVLDGNMRFCTYFKFDRQPPGLWFPPYFCIPGLENLNELTAPPESPPDGDWFCVLGSVNACILMGVMSDGIYRYCDPCHGVEPVQVWTGGPGHVATAREVCFDYQVTLEAARFFYYHGRLHPGLTWTVTPPPWQHDHDAQVDAGAA